MRLTETPTTCDPGYKRFHSAEKCLDKKRTTNRLSEANYRRLIAAAWKVRCDALDPWKQEQVDIVVARLKELFPCDAFDVQWWEGRLRVDSPSKSYLAFAYNANDALKQVEEGIRQLSWDNYEMFCKRIGINYERT